MNLVSQVYFMCSKHIYIQQLNRPELNLKFIFETKIVTPSIELQAVT